jgi:hypothetical protein
MQQVQGMWEKTIPLLGRMPQKPTVRLGTLKKISAFPKN